MNNHAMTCRVRSRLHNDMVSLPSTSSLHTMALPGAVLHFSVVDIKTRVPGGREEGEEKSVLDRELKSPQTDFLPPLIAISTDG